MPVNNAYNSKTYGLFEPNTNAFQSKNYYLTRLTLYTLIQCILYNIDYSAAAQEMVDTDSGLSLVHLTVNVYLTIPIQT